MPHRRYDTSVPTFCAPTVDGRPTRVEWERRYLNDLAAMVAALPVCEEQRSLIARSLADAIAQSSPHFNRVRFLAACKVEA